MKIKECNISRILFVVSIIFFFIIQIFIYKVQTKIKSNTEIGVEILNTKSLQNENNIYENSNFENNIWQIKIPKIELSADISNGTDKETLNKYVGHFIETPIEEGNVALAGHNRGYDVNTDIDVLENTEENILTLITCVENEPNYRRCVQAEEKDLNYNY